MSASSLRKFSAAVVVAISLVGVGCGVAPAPPSRSSVLQIIHSAFDPYGQGDKAVRVANCESGLNPLAGYPDAYYKGLFQLNPNIIAIKAYGGNFFDAKQNTLAARDLYVSRGKNWSAWPVCGKR